MLGCCLFVVDLRSGRKDRSAMASIDSEEVDAKELVTALTSGWDVPEMPEERTVRTSDPGKGAVFTPSAFSLTSKGRGQSPHRKESETSPGPGKEGKLGQYMSMLLSSGMTMGPDVVRLAAELARADEESIIR